MDEGEKCGIGSCKPGALQCCGTIKLFTVFYSISALMTSTLSVYIASQITTLEKQFGFSSTQSGFLVSCNDIGYLSVTLFVSFLADRLHAPRVLSFATILFGIAGIICAIPHFIEPIETHSLSTSNSTSKSITMSSVQMCHDQSRSNVSTQGSNCYEASKTVGVANSFTPVAMAIVAVGMIIQGIGKSPRQAFMATYIDSNVPKTHTAAYLGSILALAIFGPALGFMLGGLFNKIYVTLEDVNMSPRDPRWVGAWWLGFIIFGAGSIFTALPVMCFPKRMRKRPKRITLDNHKQKDSCKQFFKDFVKALVDLSQNKIFVLTTIGRCLKLIAVSGSVAFFSKYIETQFTIPAWRANMLTGSTRIIAVSVGTFIGGFVISKRKFAPLQCGFFIVILGLISSISEILGLVLGCDTPDINGLDLVTKNSSFGRCIDNCLCDDEDFFPVCGSDNQNYYSPCHAGCTQKAVGLGFSNCTCIGGDETAVPGLCHPECKMMIPYIVVTAVFGLVESTIIMPGFIFMIRAVKENQKGIAIAVSAFCQNLIGWFLGPVIFGEIIDLCCKIWSSKCGTTGACAFYDNISFRFAFIGFALGVRLVVICIDVVAYLIARKKTDWSVDENNEENRNNKERDSFI